MPLTSASASSRKRDTNKKDFDNDLQSYYDAITNEDILFSQENTFPQPKDLSKTIMPITNEIYVPILCKELQTQGITLRKQYIPSRFQVLKTSGFGKPSTDHSFTKETCFEHKLINLLKCEYLSLQDHKIVFRYHPLFKHLNYRMLTWYKTVNFFIFNNSTINFRE